MLELFIPIIPPIIIQSKINSIARGYVAPVAFVPTNYAPFNNPSVDYAPTNDTVVPATPVAPVVAPVTAPVSPAPMTQSDAADALRRFKDLLDSGVITQEEFNAKKKQLLGL